VDFKIGHAITEDLETIKELNLDFLKEHNNRFEKRFRINKENEKRITRYLKECISAKNMLVARSDRGIIGCLTVTDEKHPLELCHKLAYIASIYVKPQFRNKGVGKVLLSKAIGQASDRRYEQVSLRVATKNDSAVTLYENVGFRTKFLEMECDTKKNACEFTEKLLKSFFKLFRGCPAIQLQ